jgi:DNA repair exonuclease SbcCD ATPase subunit
MVQDLLEKIERLEKQEKKKVEVSEKEFTDNLEKIEELIEKQKELEGKREKIESELKRLEIGERGEKAEELKKTLKEYEANSHTLQYRLEKLRTYLRLDFWYDEIKGLTLGKGEKSFLDKALEEPEKYKEVLTVLFDEAYKGFVEKAGARKLREKLKDKWNEEKEKEKMLRAVEKLESESGLRFLIEEAGAIDELTKVSSKWLRIRLCRMHEYLYEKLGAKVEHVYEQMLKDEDNQVKTAALEALKNIEELKRPY